MSEVVVRYLEIDGYEVEAVDDGLTALERAQQRMPDLVILDIMLPGIDGLEVCRRLREMAPVPVIMLTALGEESDRIIGLELGADDYITKPFSPRELAARVKSVLRRAGGTLGVPTPTASGMLTADDLEVDVHARDVLVNGASVTLTALEFDLLVFLMSQPRRVLTREDLFKEVWGYTFGDASTVTVHVRRLRSKIEEDPAHPRHIVTVWGVGYRFEP